MLVVNLLSLFLVGSDLSLSFHTSMLQLPLTDATEYPTTPPWCSMHALISSCQNCMMDRRKPWIFNQSRDTGDVSMVIDYTCVYFKLVSPFTTHV